jgi:hypothetical protein
MATPSFPLNGGLVVVAPCNLRSVSLPGAAQTPPVPANLADHSSGIYIFAVRVLGTPKGLPSPQAPASRITRADEAPWQKKSVRIPASSPLRGMHPVNTRHCPVGNPQDTQNTTITLLPCECECRGFVAPRIGLLLQFCIGALKAPTHLPGQRGHRFL